MLHRGARFAASCPSQRTADARTDREPAVSPDVGRRRCDRDQNDPERSRSGQPLTSGTSPPEEAACQPHPDRPEQDPTDGDDGGGWLRVRLKSAAIGLPVPRERLRACTTALTPPRSPPYYAGQRQQESLHGTPALRRVSRKWMAVRNQEGRPR